MASLKDRIADILIENEHEAITLANYCDSMADKYLDKINSFGDFIMSKSKGSLEDRLEYVLSKDDFLDLNIMLNELRDINENKYNMIVALVDKATSVKDYINVFALLYAHLYLYPLIADIGSFSNDSASRGYKAFTRKNKALKLDYMGYIGGDDRDIRKVVEDTIGRLLLITYSSLTNDLAVSKRNEMYITKSVKLYKNNIRNNIYTSSNYTFNQGILKAMQDTEYSKYKYCAILDSRTSEICKGMNNNVYKIEDAEVGVNFPPMHHHCRSYAIPIK